VKSNGFYWWQQRVASAKHSLLTPLIMVFYLVFIVASAAFATVDVDCNITATANEIVDRNPDSIVSSLNDDLSKLGACATALENVLAGANGVDIKIIDIKNKVITNKINDVHAKLLKQYDNLAIASKNSEQAALHFFNTSAEFKPEWGALITKYDLRRASSVRNIKAYSLDINKLYESKPSLLINSKAINAVDKFGTMLDWLQAGLSAEDFFITWSINGYEQDKFDVAMGSLIKALFPEVLGPFDAAMTLSGMSDQVDTVYYYYIDIAAKTKNIVSDLAILMQIKGYKGESLAISDYENVYNTINNQISILKKMDSDIRLYAINPFTLWNVALNGKKQTYLNDISFLRSVLSELRNVNHIDLVNKFYHQGITKKTEETVAVADKVLMKSGSINRLIENAQNKSSFTTNPYLQIIVPDKNKAAFDANDDSFYADPGDVIRLRVQNVASSPMAAMAGLPVKVVVFLPNGDDKLVNGTLSGEEISFTIGTTIDGVIMPAGRYRVFTAYAIDSSGNKPNLGSYTLQQLVEKDSTTTGTTNPPPPSTTGAITLPRTGQYLCYDSAGTEIPCAGTGQDGDIQAGKPLSVPRFLDNGDQTMTDKHTGLIWTKDANAPGHIVCGPGTTKTWQGALNYVDCLNSNNYLNHNDWRLPNRKELMSIVDRQQADSSTWLLSQGFNYVQPGAYWSSTTSAYWTGSAWYVHIRLGYASFGPMDLDNIKINEFNVWPVRGDNVGGDVQLPRTGQSNCYNSTGTVIDCATLGQTQDAAMNKGVAWDAASRFTDNSNGTITDNLTGLIWLQNANCTATVGGIAKSDGSLNWASALTWSNNLTSGNCGLTDGSAAGDWRLPNVEELESLADFFQFNITGHPFSNVQSPYYSSSSSYVYNNTYNNAWVADLHVGGTNYASKSDNYTYVWPVRGGHLDHLRTVPLTPKVTFLSENLPDSSYQVGPATKAWRFKSGASSINGLKAVLVSDDGGLGIAQSTITDIGPEHNGNIPANTEFLVYLPINPEHYSPSQKSLRSSYWKLVDYSGQPVTITNSKTGQFWLKINTNRAPEFSPLQLESVSGLSGRMVSLPILASDPDGDYLTYSVVSGGGSIVPGTWQGKPAMLYQNTFPATSQTVFPVVIQVYDICGSTAQFTIQAVIAPNGNIREFYKDTPYRVAGDPDPVCDTSRIPVFKPNLDQYVAIHYLTLNGIVIGTPDKDEPAKRNYMGCSIATQAEALAMIMKSATVHGKLALDAEPRWLPNLVITDVEQGIFKNYTWAAPYVLKAEALGMIPSADTFNPAAEAKREWLATILTRMLRLGTPPEAIVPADYLFADSANFSTPEANSEALAAAYFGYMLGEWGSSVSFNPAAPMIRADVAMVASKILRRPAADAIETAGLQSVIGNILGYPPFITHGQTFTVTGMTNLTGYQIVMDSNGYVSEGIIPAANYTTATVIRPGSGVVGTKLVYSLAASPVVVPTATPDIAFSEKRSLVALLESKDWDNRNPVRNIVRLDYHVLFPDADGDGVRDELDKWPNHSLYSTDANNNGIPDNADSLWNLSARNGSEIVTVNGFNQQLISAIIYSGALPLSGSCGSANGMTYSFLPPVYNNLCNNGIASTVTGTGPWSWTCAGIGGTNAACSANIQTYAITFSAGTGGSLEGIPSQQVNYGSSNSAVTAVPQNGYHFVDWTENGIITSFSAALTVANINSTHSYLANFAPNPNPVNGVCGSSNGQTFTTAPMISLCASGTNTPVNGSGPWNWSCNGSNGGTNASCSASLFAASTPVNGVCGSANGQTFANAPTANLCASGANTPITGSGPWSWSCNGSNGGTNASCSASLYAGRTPVNGVCGSANGQTFANAPAANLCAAGTNTPIAGSGPWSWSCNGSNGGTSASCSATSPAQIVASSFAGKGGTIEPPSVTGDSPLSGATFTVTAEPGYVITSVTGCGGTLSGNTYTIGPVTADCRVEAFFSLPEAAAQLQGTYRFVFQEGGLRPVSGASAFTTAEGDSGSVTFDGAGGCTMTVAGTKIEETSNGISTAQNQGSFPCRYAGDGAGLFQAFTDTEVLFRGYFGADGDLFTSINAGENGNGPDRKYRLAQMVGVKTGSGMSPATLNGTYSLAVQEYSLRSSGTSGVANSVYLANGTLSFDGTGGCAIEMTGTSFDAQGNNISIYPETISKSCSYAVDAGGGLTASVNGFDVFSGTVSAGGGAILIGGYYQNSDGGSTGHSVEQTVSIRRGEGKSIASVNGVYGFTVQDFRFSKGTDGSVRRGLNGQSGILTFDGAGGCSYKHDDAEIREEGTGVSLSRSVAINQCTYSVSLSGDLSVSFGKNGFVARLSADDGTLIAGDSYSGEDNGVIQLVAVKTGAMSVTPSNRSLTVAVTGSGTVTSSPQNNGAIACTGSGSGCSTAFPSSTAVALTATSSATTMFSAWGGACSGLSPTCNLTMDGDKTVTAVFVNLPPFKVFAALTGYFSLWGDFYGPVVSSGPVTVHAKAGTVRVDSLVLDREIVLVLKGGFDSGFGANPGMTDFLGTLTVGKGALTVEHLAIY
jgi:uncharacterized protein DUF1566/List-Bact-rpt repeat protein